MEEHKENFDLEKPKEKTPTELFREEINAIRRSEETGELKTVHLTGNPRFSYVNVEELTEEDRVMWEKVKTRNVNYEEFVEYQNKASMSGNVSRKNFSAFLANKAVAVISMPKSK